MMDLVQVRKTTAAVCVALGGLAAAATFTDVSGDHKLSTGANWGGTVPGTGVVATIGPLASGTYTTDADLSTGAATLGTGTAAAPVTIALGAYSWTATGWSTSPSYVILDGGTWTVNGDANPGYSGNGSFVCLTNGATMTLSGRTNLGWAGSDNTLFVSGANSKWIANGGTQAHVGNGVNNARNLIYVNDGAAFSTKSNPFNIGQDGYGNTVRVESGATATFAGEVNLGRGNGDPETPAYAGKGENAIIVKGGTVDIPTLQIGRRPCAPSNRVEVTDNGLLRVNTLNLGASGSSAGSSGSSFNSVYVADGGVVTASVAISTAECAGYAPPHGNVFTVGTNGGFVARSSGHQTYVGKFGYGNGLRVMGAKEFDVSVSSTTVGDGTSSNNWIRATDTDRMKFANLYCGGTGNGNFAEFVNVTNLVFDQLMCGQYSSNNTVTIMGTKSFKANEIHLGRYCGSGNRMTIGVTETPDIPVNCFKIGYGTKRDERGDAHCADDCHLKIVGCGTERLAFNPFDKVYNGTYGAGCSFEADHIEQTGLGDVGLVSPGNGVQSNFTFTVGGNSRIQSAGSIGIPGGNGSFRFVLAGEGTTWTNGNVGSNNGYLNVGITRPYAHFAIEDGAEMFCGDSTAAFGNAGHSSLTVGNDAKLNVLRLRMNGSDNALVISNGTLFIRGECGLPSTTLTNVTAVGNEIRFHGTHPRLETANTRINLGAYDLKYDGYPKRDTTLFFDIPETGYVQPPVETTEKDIIISTSTKMTAEVEAFRKAGGGDVLLMRSKTGIGIGDMETLKSTLPERTSLRLVNGNTELWLHVSDRKKLFIIFR